MKFNERSYYQLSDTCRLTKESESHPKLHIFVCKYGKVNVEVLSSLERRQCFQLVLRVENNVV